MRFDELIQGFAGERLNPAHNPEVRRLSVDSRATEPGDCFVALRRGHTDAHHFAAAALEAGAVALVLERGAAVPPGLLEEPGEAAIFLVDDSERLLAQLANRLAGEPTRDLTVVAVTGTNGKTTTTLLLESVFRAAGKPCGVIGTLFFRLERWEIHGRHTTPQAHELYWLLGEMRQRGAGAVAMEASSHGLELNRLYGALVDAAVFTNLSHDHLDFHGDMESYFAAKRKLFTEYLPASRAAGKPGVAIVNIEDPWGRRLAAELGPDAPRLTYALAGADICAEDLSLSGAGSRFTLRLPGGEAVAVDLPLVARHNVMNALGAAGAAYACGIGAEDIAVGLSAAGAIPGRLERVARADGRGPAVFVDYSHTPDALERALDTLRDLGPTELRVVFGCGGDRDRTKRPVMGRIAAERADLVVVTNDNPRTEDPQSIIAAVVDGVREVRLPEAGEGSRGWVAIADRRAAIARAVQGAPPGALVLVAGKGHETYQEIQGQRHPFDDRQVAREVLAEWAPDRTVPIFRTWPAAQLAAAAGGELRGEPALYARAIRNDSRQVEPGDLFVALRAERDGHDFIPAARERGARVFLVEAGRGVEPLRGEAVIAVSDTVQGLAALGRALWAAHAEVRPDRVTVGLTGSNGKTTTKELVARMLELAREPEAVLATAGNLNNHIGLPMTLARLAPAHGYVVLEMGASVPGDIAHLVGIAPVQRALVTSIAPAHLEGLGSEDAVASEKGQIFRGSPAPGLAVLPWEWKERLVPDGFGGRVATFGHVPNASVVLAGYQAGPPARLQLSVGPPLEPVPFSFSVELGLLGRHNALNLAAAAALVWDLLGDSPALVARVARRAKPVPGRLTVRAARDGAQLLDDAYNANPGSMEAALVVLGECAGRRWAILGDMLELGEASAAAHRELGEKAAAHGVERLWAVGALAEEVVAGARGAGLADVASFGDAEACALAAVQALAPDDVVLVKGSRGVRLERVVAALLPEEGD